MAQYSNVHGYNWTLFFVNACLPFHLLDGPDDDLDGRFAGDVLQVAGQSHADFDDSGYKSTFSEYR